MDGTTSVAIEATEKSIERNRKRDVIGETTLHEEQN
jgi:hypothetical protein